ncbi:MAG: response regulator transcription factor [Marmoricola sp.]|nr:response regulator transcription factor [Marmoricola sp.]
MLTVGVCEDDPAIRRVLQRSLEYAEHRAVVAHTGAEALRIFPAATLDVIVMDIGLPDADGRDVVHALKTAGQFAPVLFLTALGAVHDRLSGFAAGAEDYVAKPFDVKEVLARIDVLGRRGLQPRSAGLNLGFELNPMTHALETPTESVSLTPTEFRVLAAIAQRPGEVVRRRAVIAAGWPDGAYVAPNTVDSFLSRLRSKLETVGAPVVIETVRGVGFRMR